MQRLLLAHASRATVVATVFALAVPVGTAHAQLVNRSRGGDAQDDDSTSDEDVLAPSTPSTAAPPSAPAARAYQVGLVPLVPLGGTSKTAADQVTAELLKQLDDGQQFGAAMLSVDVKGRASAAEIGSDKKSEQGAAELARGQELLKKLQFGKARKALEGALERFERGAAALTDPGVLTAAHVALAEVAARQGQDEGAEAQLTRAAAYNPELQLDKKAFPPQFIRSFVRMRDKVLKAGKGAIVVDASATGASVEIDGRAVGAAPVTVGGLPAGRHLVRALREGLPAWGAIVDVGSDKSVTVSPGFLSADGSGWMDDLQKNQLRPVAAAPVAAAARAAGLKGALVGVLTKGATSITVQLVLVDAATAKLAKLSTVTFQADLLDVSIETLKARESVEELYAADSPPGSFASSPIDVLIDGATTAASAEMRTVTMRYDVKVSREREGSRLIGGDKAPVAEEDGDEADDDSRSVLSAGKSGKRKRLEDEDDPYLDSRRGGASSVDPDAPVTQQPWFMPVVIGGGAVAVVVLGGATVVSLVALKVLPDPRPAGGGTVTVNLP